MRRLLLGYYTLGKLGDFYSSEPNVDKRLFHASRISGTVLTVNVLYLCFLLFENQYLQIGITTVFAFVIQIFLNTNQLENDYQITPYYLKWLYASLAIIHFVGSFLLFFNL